MKWLLKLLRDPLLLALLTVHIAILVCTRFTAWPEMLIYPYLLERGFAFYGEIVQPYMPLLPYVLHFIFGLFGNSVAVLHYFTIAVIVTIDLLLLGIVQTHFKVLRPQTVLAIFIIFQIFLGGNGMWFDLFAVVPILTAYYCTLLYRKNRKLKNFLVAGFAVGIAIITKQTAVWFLVPLVIEGYMVNRKAIMLVLLVASIPLALLLILFRPVDIWNWAMVYPLFKMAKTPGYALYPSTREFVILLFLLLPLLFWTTKLLELFRERNFILLWMGAAFGFLFPRFAWFHLQPLAPFLAITTALIFASAGKSRLFKIGKVGYLVILLIMLLRVIKQELFLPPRFFEPEVITRATTLSSLIPRNQPVFFYNDMGNEMVAGQFLPIKPWAYTFPWYMEIPGLQERIISAIEADKVQWVVAKPFGNEGYYVPGSYRPQIIEAYIQSHFSFIATAGDLTVLKRL